MKSKRPYILISNDDGVQSPGIKTLARAMRDWADVIVVAPEREQSATSHSITLHRPLRIRRVKKAVYAVDGTPTDCITLAVNKILDRRPEMILSGINSGSNLGDDVHYSGTVSAAVEGTLMGIPSVAISLAAHGERRRHYVTAAGFSLEFCKRVRWEEVPKGVLFNINVPDVRPQDVNGVELTRLGKRNYGDIIVEKTDPRGRRYYWIGGDQSSFHDIAGSDCMAVQEGKISVTPMKTDLTMRSLIKKMDSWFS